MTSFSPSSFIFLYSSFLLDFISFFLLFSFNKVCCVPIKFSKVDKDSNSFIFLFPFKITKSLQLSINLPLFSILDGIPNLASKKNFINKSI
jgi:hypothetical protein